MQFDGAGSSHQNAGMRLDFELLLFGWRVRLLAPWKGILSRA